MANLPPTPAPSTDIAGKPTALSAHLDTIALPPAAIRNGRASVSSNSTTDAASDSSYLPISPPSPEVRQKPQSDKPQSVPRKRSSEKAELAQNAADSNNNNYALPPPPTRSRKIIQMKPQSGKGKGASQQQQQQQEPGPSPAIAAQQSQAQTQTQGKAQVAASPSQQPQGSAQVQATGGKKKQANTSTAAGRKIARKTAHSLIERRRRSKMNEEFGVLKDMIPACAGQDMHKLAILQASIEYMRYLESCVTELKAAHKNCKTADGREALVLNPPSYTASTARTTPNEPDFEEEDDDEDEEMADDAGTPQEVPLDRRYTNSTAGHSRPSVSPAILPSATTSPLFTRPSTSNNQSFSNLPSPAFYAQQQQHPQRLPSLSLASPVLQAQRSGPPSASGQENRYLPSVTSLASAQSQQPVGENDEATASALLMLTADRRSWTGRGMSVKDLLSSQ